MGESEGEPARLSRRWKPKPCFPSERDPAIHNVHLLSRYSPVSQCVPECVFLLPIRS